MVNRRLYVFPLSPFSRRARLALAHKGLDAELIDGRADPSKVDEARALGALPTFPILVEPNGRALGDSTAIAHYLDLAYGGAPAIWPRGEHALGVVEATTLVDAALNIVVDLGTRYFALRESAAWEKVKGDMLGRAQAALDALAARAAERTGKTWTDAGWCAADMWLTTMTIWIEAWPARAKHTPTSAQVLSLGLRLPAALSRWTDAHRGRADIAALGPSL